jgi:hypothetical protein
LPNEFSIYGFVGIALGGNVSGDVTALRPRKGTQRVVFMQQLPEKQS